MFVAIFILLVLPFIDTSKIKGNTYKPLYILAFWLFALNFLVLMWLGSCHVEPPFIIAGQIATVYYFLHFLLITPLFGIIDNVFGIIGTTWKNEDQHKPKTILPEEIKRGNNNVLLPRYPEEMSEEERAIWEKIKADIIAQNIIIYAAPVGGYLVS